MLKRSLVVERLQLLKSPWLLLCILCLLTYWILVSLRIGDFEMFLDSCEHMKQKTSIYYPYGNRNLYLYSPAATLLLMPFSYLPPFLGRLLWKAFSIYLVIMGYQILKSYADTKSWDNKSLRYLAVYTFISVIHFLNLNLGAGQMTIFVLFACLKSISLCDKDKQVEGAIWLSTAMVIKLMPLIIIPYLIYRSYFKCVFFVIIFTSVLLFSPLLFMESDYYVWLLNDWTHLVFPSEELIKREGATIFESLQSVLVVYFSQNAPDVPVNFNIVNLNNLAISLLSKLIVLLFTFLTLAFLDKNIFSDKVENNNKLRQISYLCIATPLIFPMQQKYSYLFLAPTYFYLIYYLITLKMAGKAYKDSLRIIVLMVASLFLSSISTMDMIVGFQIKEYSEYLKLTPMGGILLLIALYHASADKLNGMTSPNSNKLVSIQGTL